MSNSSSTKHEIVEMSDAQPFVLRAIPSDFHPFETEKWMNHWHDELEITYDLIGNHVRYINGTAIVSNPGRLVVTNSQYIHATRPDQTISGEHLYSTLLIMLRLDFLYAVFPEYQHLYFTNLHSTASEETVQILSELSLLALELPLSPYALAEKNAEVMDIHYEMRDPVRNLEVKSLLVRLLAQMLYEGTAERSEASRSSSPKNIEKVKAIISFIETNYSERIPQSLVAEKFHYSSSHFSKLFRHFTGMTYSEYLLHYRLQMAKKDLLDTEWSVLDIALKNGFTDDRRLILSFKKEYGDTPLQYRRKNKI